MSTGIFKYMIKQSLKWDEVTHMIKGIYNCSRKTLTAIIGAKADAIRTAGPNSFYYFSCETDLVNLFLDVMEVKDVTSEVQNPPDNEDFRAYEFVNHKAGERYIPYEMDIMPFDEAMAEISRAMTGEEHCGAMEVEDGTD